MRGRQTKKKERRKKDFQLIVFPDQGLGIEGERQYKGGRRGRRGKERRGGGGRSSQQTKKKKISN